MKLPNRLQYSQRVFVSFGTFITRLHFWYYHGGFFLSGLQCFGITYKFMRICLIQFVKLWIPFIRQLFGGFPTSFPIYSPLFEPMVFVICWFMVFYRVLLIIGSFCWILLSGCYSTRPNPSNWDQAIQSIRVLGSWCKKV